jgi:hypothetical protein
MKLDPGIHIGMHVVCFSKTRCDTSQPNVQVSSGARTLMELNPQPRFSEEQPPETPSNEL